MKFERLIFLHRTTFEKNASGLRIKSINKVMQLFVVMMGENLNFFLAIEDQHDYIA